MKFQTMTPLSCLKWGVDGDLSAHDTTALLNRLVSAEKSRRGLLDHHNGKIGKAAKPSRPARLSA